MLKILADAGIIGFPNAGKSSLLSKLTPANPEIAPYPFTTLSPVLGVMRRDGEEAVLADVPGLIEGAHSGQGLGLLFLKHIERTRMLIHVIDVSDPRAIEDPIGVYDAIRNELSLYDETLKDKPEITVLNKIDLLEGGVPESVMKAFESRGIRPCAVSCASGSGLEELKDRVFECVESAPEVSETVIPVQPKKLITDFKVRRDNESFVVEGYKLERLMAMMDLENPDVVTYLQKKLKGAGVEDALIRAGAKTGDLIIIGGRSFDFDPEM